MIIRGSKRSSRIISGSERSSAWIIIIIRILGGRSVAIVALVALVVPSHLKLFQFFAWWWQCSKLRASVCPLQKVGHT